MDLICAVSVASDVLVPVFPVFVFPKVIMFTPYRANRTISAVVRTAKCAICGRFASFPKNALRRVESACQGFQLATERFVFAFQLVDAPSLLFDDDKRRLAVKAAARAERCRRHGDGSRVGRDGHVSGYIPPPDTFAPSSGCGAFPMFALSGLAIPARSSSFSLRVTA